MSSPITVEALTAQLGRATTLVRSLEGSAVYQSSSTGEVVVQIAVAHERLGAIQKGLNADQPLEGLQRDLARAVSDARGTIDLLSGNTDDAGSLAELTAIGKQTDALLNELRESAEQLALMTRGGVGSDLQRPVQGIFDPSRLVVRDALEGLEETEGSRFVVQRGNVIKPVSLSFPIPTLAFIPSHTFTMGSNAFEDIMGSNAFDDEQPIRQVTLDSWFEAETATTNRELNPFIEAESKRPLGLLGRDKKSGRDFVIYRVTREKKEMLEPFRIDRRDKTRKLIEIDTDRLNELFYDAAIIEEFNRLHQIRGEELDIELLGFARVVPHENRYEHYFREVLEKEGEEAWKKRVAEFADPDKPATVVNSYEALGYLGWLNDQLKNGLLRYQDAQGETQTERILFMLPSEAEWEASSRGGPEHNFEHGTVDGRLRDDAGNKLAHFGERSPAKVRSYSPIPSNGLFDKSGNVWEWVNDRYANRYDPDQLINPTGPESGKYRVLRGGSWYYVQTHARSAYRLNINPDDRYYYFGIRPAAAPQDSKK